MINTMANTNIRRSAPADIIFKVKFLERSLQVGLRLAKKKGRLYKIRLESYSEDVGGRYAELDIRGKVHDDMSELGLQCCLELECELVRAESPEHPIASTSTANQGDEANIPYCVTYNPSEGDSGVNDDMMSFTITLEDYMCGNSAQIIHSANVNRVSGSIQPSRNENNETDG